MDAATAFDTELAVTFDVCTDDGTDAPDGRSVQNAQPIRAIGNDDPIWRAAAMKRFLAVLERGLSISAAVRASGVSRRAVYTWREAYPSFASAWKQSEAIGVDTHVDRIAAAGNFDWRASLAWLRAKRPEQWGNRVHADSRSIIDLTATVTTDATPCAVWLAGLLGTADGHPVTETELARFDE
jgi:hypothetical protein